MFASGKQDLSGPELYPIPSLSPSPASRRPALGILQPVILLDFQSANSTATARRGENSHGWELKQSSWDVSFL